MLMCSYRRPGFFKSLKGRMGGPERKASGAPKGGSSNRILPEEEILHSGLRENLKRRNDRVPGKKFRNPLTGLDEPKGGEGENHGKKESSAVQFSPV